MSGKKRDELHDKWLFYTKMKKETEEMKVQADKSGDMLVKATIAITLRMWAELADLSRLMLDD